MSEIPADGLSFGSEEEAKAFADQLMQQQKESEEQFLRRVDEKIKNSNTLTVQTKKTEEEKIEKKEESALQKIYQWSILLSGEEDNSPFYIPEEWLKIVRRLRLVHGHLLKIIGDQGIGKTTMARFLKNGLDKNTTIMKRMQKGYEEFGRFERNQWIDTVSDLDEREHRKVIVTDKDWEWNVSDDTINLIVDMWDYNRNNQKDITKALDGIQEYWIHRVSENKRNKTPLVNIVIFLQKEALPLHFFLGKMELFEIKPIPPLNLVAYYENLFHTLKPFTEESLTEIAYYSNGIFRKFKQYISLCIEEILLTPEKTLTLEDVKQIITPEKIVFDMELQLSKIWQRNTENRILSVKVLRFLREHGETKQHTIEEEFFYNNKMACSRLLNALKLHNFVEFKVDGKERLWNIKHVEVYPKHTKKCVDCGTVDQSNPYRVWCPRGKGERTRQDVCILEAEE